MAKSPKKKQRQREDLNQLATHIIAEATGEAPKTRPTQPREKTPQRWRWVVGRTEG